MVIKYLISVPPIDLFVRNFQNESVYDIAAEKGDLATCDLIESFERVQWIKSNSDGSFSPRLVLIM